MMGESNDDFTTNQTLMDGIDTTIVKAADVTLAPNNSIGASSARNVMPPPPATTTPSVMAEQQADVAVPHQNHPAVAEQRPSQVGQPNLNSATPTPPAKRNPATSSASVMATELVVPYQNHPPVAAQLPADLIDHQSMPPPANAATPSTSHHHFQMNTPTFAHPFFNHPHPYFNPMLMGQNQFGHGGGLGGSFFVGGNNEVTPTPLHNLMNPPHSGPHSGLKPCHIQGDSFRQPGYSPFHRASAPHHQDASAPIQE